MMQNKQYRVVVIEPSPIIISGIKHLIENSKDFLYIGSIADMEFLIQRLTPLRPEIIIINPSIIDFHKRSSVHSLFQNFSDASIVALCYNFIDSNILKQFDGIIEINDEKLKIENTLINSVNKNKNSDTPDSSELSDREKEILISIAKGFQNKEIADIHNISIHTVISHRKNITRKTGIKSVSGLTIYALLNNLINQNEFS